MKVVGGMSDDYSSMFVCLLVLFLTLLHCLYKVFKCTYYIIKSYLSCIMQIYLESSADWIFQTPIHLVRHMYKTIVVLYSCVDLRYIA